MLQLVAARAAAPGLAAKALSHLAQALVGDGDVDVRINAVTAVGKLVAAVLSLDADVRVQMDLTCL